MTTMARSRLQLISATDLQDKIALLPADERKAVALNASRLAVNRAELRDPLIELALEKIERGETKDEFLSARLRKLVESLDDEYLSKADSDNGREEYLRLFRKARAANSVLFCLDPDSPSSAAEAIYEASHVMENINELRKALKI